MTDRLVEKIPVYLSQEFSQTLHLIKSPLRDPNRPYNDIGPLKSATFKPQHNIIAFQYGLTKNDAHYNHSAENQIDSFDFQTQTTPKRANYVIGQRLNDSMILHPIHAIHSLLPVFTHVDSMQKEYDNDLIPQVEDEETALKQVQIKVKRAEKVGGVKRVTHDTLMQSVKDEKAQNCTMFNISSTDVFNGNAVIPIVPPNIQAKWSQIRKQLRSMRSKPTITMGDDGDDNNDDNDDIDCDQEVKLLSLQEKNCSEFQSRQDQLFNSQPLYNNGTLIQPKLTSYPIQMINGKPSGPKIEINKNISSSGTTTTTSATTTKNNNSNINTSSSSSSSSSLQSNKQTPLAQFIAPFTTHSPSQGGGTEALNTITLSTNKITELTVEQVLKFLLFSRVVTFKAISQNLSIREPNQFRQLLNLLQKQCLLVHGNFVLKSQFVYNHDGTNSKVPLNKQQQHIKTQTIRLSLARTYILHAFSKVEPPKDLVDSYNKAQAANNNSKFNNVSETSSSPSLSSLSRHPLLNWSPTLSQKKISQFLMLGPKELLPILKEIASPQAQPIVPMYDKSIQVREDTIWVFKLPIDWFFLQTFPSIVTSSAEQLEQIMNHYYPETQ